MVIAKRYQKVKFIIDVLRKTYYDSYMSKTKTVKKPMTRIRFQAGYYFGGEWYVCGYGLSEESARHNLCVRIAEQKSNPLTLESCVYKEQKTTETAGTISWPDCECCDSQFNSLGECDCDGMREMLEAGLEMSGTL